MPVGSASRVLCEPNLAFMDGGLIYGLIDPRNGELRYVGKSTSGLKRPRQHIFPSMIKAAGDTYKTRWLRQLLAKNLKPDIEVLENCDSPEDLNEAERHHIAYWKFLGCRLTNLTSGGDGLCGYRHTDESRFKISKALQRHSTSPQTSKRVAEANRERVWSAEDRKKLSSIRLGVRFSDEVRRKMSLAQQNQSAETRVRRAWTLGGRSFSDQYGNVYQTQMEAARALNLHASNINQVLKGRRGHTGGFVFTYTSEVFDGNP
ncbi:MAG: hypothetical protein EPO08_21015 [Rhodospirillaceae bacterium]|nr:MAG: hypothetical protein EPO08_21015 [Rhodospirillaceae bacterium]